MITEAKDFLKLVTIDKDINLGKYIPDYSWALLQDTLKNKIETTLENNKCSELFDAINSTLEKSRMTNKTNIELHFTVRADSTQQYVSPYTKEYKVGPTEKIIHEDVIWSYRPEYVHPGRLYEKTYIDKTGLKEDKDYKFGSVDDYWNIIALYTYEKNKSKDGETEYSTVHITVFIPVGNQMFAEMSALHKENIKNQKAKNEIMRKSSFAKNIKNSIKKNKKKK